jgi:hypothetical protein
MPVRFLYFLHFFLLYCSVYADTYFTLKIENRSNQIRLKYESLKDKEEYTKVSSISIDDEEKEVDTLRRTGIVVEKDETVCLYILSKTIPNADGSIPTKQDVGQIVISECSSEKDEEKKTLLNIKSDSLKAGWVSFGSQNDFRIILSPSKKIVGYEVVIPSDRSSNKLVEEPVSPQKKNTLLSFFSRMFGKHKA